MLRAVLLVFIARITELAAIRPGSVANRETQALVSEQPPGDPAVRQRTVVHSTHHTASTQSTESKAAQGSAVTRLARDSSSSVAGTSVAQNVRTGATAAASVNTTDALKVASQAGAKVQGSEAVDSSGATAQDSRTDLVTVGRKTGTGSEQVISKAGASTSDVSIGSMSSAKALTSGGVATTGSAKEQVVAAASSRTLATEGDGSTVVAVPVSSGDSTSETDRSVRTSDSPGHDSKTVTVDSSRSTVVDSAENLPILGDVALQVAAEDHQVSEGVRTVEVKGDAHMQLARANVSAAIRSGRASSLLASANVTANLSNATHKGPTWDLDKRWMFPEVNRSSVTTNGKTQILTDVSPGGNPNATEQRSRWNALLRRRQWEAVSEKDIPAAKLDALKAVLESGPPSAHTMPLPEDIRRRQDTRKADEYKAVDLGRSPTDPEIRIDFNSMVADDEEEIQRILALIKTTTTTTTTTTSTTTTSEVMDVEPEIPDWKEKDAFPDVHPTVYSQKGLTLQALFVLGEPGATVPQPYDWTPIMSVDRHRQLRRSNPELFVPTAQDMKEHFGAAPGELLPQGQRCEASAGEAYKAWASARGLTVDDNKVFGYVRKDAGSAESAKAFGQGLGLKESVRLTTNDKLLSFGLDDDLQLQDDKKLAATCQRALPAETAEAVKDITGHDGVSAWASRDFTEPMSILTWALGHDPPLEDEPVRLSLGGDDVSVYPPFGSGRFAEACRFTEFMAAEVMAGLPKHKTVYGKIGLSAGDIPLLQKTCYGLYALYGNQVNHQRFGMELDVNIMSAMRSSYFKNSQKAKSVVQKDEDNFVFYEGNVVNMAFLRHTLGMPVALPSKGMPYNGGRLHVALYKGPEESKHVAVGILSPSFKSLAEGCTSPLPLDRFQMLRMPCSDFDNETMTCSWESFQANAYKQLRHLLQWGNKKNKYCMSKDSKKWLQGIMPSGAPGRGGARLIAAALALLGAAARWSQ